MPTILLVDCDPLQALLRKSILEQKFPDVRRVSDAAEALCLIEQPNFASNLALIVTGRQRPGISGPDFVAEIVRRLPELPVLVLGSGAETASDYPHYAGICFRSRSIASEELLALTGMMIARGHLDAA